MTIIEDDIDFPTDDRQSRINRPPKSETPDDYATADQRIEAFRERYPGGSILPDEPERRDITGTTHREWTVRVFVRKNADSEKPDAIAHATRGTDDADPGIAARPQEAAETSATSRALRFLGILVTPTRQATPLSLGEPQTDVQVGETARVLRERSGISQTHLAREMRSRGFKWTQPSVAAVENGDRKLTLTEAQHLAALIGFPGQGAS